MVLLRASVYVLVVFAASIWRFAFAQGHFGGLHTPPPQHPTLQHAPPLAAASALGSAHGTLNVLGGLDMKPPAGGSFSSFGAAQPPGVQAAAGAGRTARPSSAQQPLGVPDLSGLLSTAGQPGMSASAAAQQPQVSESDAMRLLRVSGEMTLQSRFSEAKAALLASAQLLGGTPEVVAQAEILRWRLGLPPVGHQELLPWLGLREAEPDWAEVPSLAPPGAASAREGVDKHSARQWTWMGTAIGALSVILAAVLFVVYRLVSAAPAGDGDVPLLAKSATTEPVAESVDDRPAPPKEPEKVHSESDEREQGEVQPQHAPETAHPEQTPEGHAEDVGHGQTAEPDAADDAAAEADEEALDAPAPDAAPDGVAEDEPLTVDEDRAASQDTRRVSFGTVQRENFAADEQSPPATEVSPRVADCDEDWEEDEEDVMELDGDDYEEEEEEGQEEGEEEALEPCEVSEEDAGEDVSEQEEEVVEENAAVAAEADEVTSGQIPEGGSQDQLVQSCREVAPANGGSTAEMRMVSAAQALRGAPSGGSSMLPRAAGLPTAGELRTSLTRQGITAAAALPAVLHTASDEEEEDWGWGAVAEDSGAAAANESASAAAAASEPRGSHEGAQSGRMTSHEESDETTGGAASASAKPKVEARKAAGKAVPANKEVARWRPGSSVAPQLVATDGGVQFPESENEEEDWGWGRTLKQEVKDVKEDEKVFEEEKQRAAEDMADTWTLKLSAWEEAQRTHSLKKTLQEKAAPKKKPIQQRATVAPMPVQAAGRVASLPSSGASASTRVVQGADTEPSADGDLAGAYRSATSGYIYFTGNPEKPKKPQGRTWYPGARKTDDDRPAIPGMPASCPKTSATTEGDRHREHERDGFVPARPTRFRPTGVYVRLQGTGAERFLPVEHMQPHTEASISAIREHVRKAGGRLSLRELDEENATMFSKRDLKAKGDDILARKRLMEQAIADLRETWDSKRWITGRVSAVQANGVFINIVAGKDALLPIAEIPDSALQAATIVPDIGALESENKEQEGQERRPKLVLDQRIEVRIVRHNWTADTFLVSMLTYDESVARRKAAKGEEPRDKAAEDDSKKEKKEKAQRKKPDIYQVPEDREFEFALVSKDRIPKKSYLQRLSDKGFSIINDEAAEKLNSYLRQKAEEKNGSKPKGAAKAAAAAPQIVEKNYVVNVARGMNLKTIGQVTLPGKPEEKELKQAAVKLAQEEGELQAGQQHKGVTLAKNILTIKL
eukprot:TRINITY_DN6922_c0_g1_i1.p1 TRINITY_DN6922_c0_g1~~TRINITY_DN6922_c0_g1_i1.p1  ORF type:complete len:1242 (+),score=362.33 TRINITY_DN6922_c0_g1_i1:111-3836(+)